MDVAEAGETGSGWTLTGHAQRARLGAMMLDRCRSRSMLHNWLKQEMGV